MKTRRDFLSESCAAAVGLGVAPFAGVCSGSGPPARAEAEAGASGAAAAPGKAASGRAERRDEIGPRVVRRDDAKVFGGGGHDAGRVAGVVNRSLASLLDVKDTSEAFRALFDPDEVVCIKVNCLAGPGMSSSPAVVDALVAGLNRIGVSNDRIWIWERTTRELKRAGFEPNRYSDSRPRCAGNDDLGFEREIRFSGEVGSLWSNVLARRADALINVPVLKDHDLAGVGCGMKNMYGAIHNPNRYHDDNCDPFVADVSDHEYVEGKLRLVLCDALTAQYHGGPARVLEHQWRPGAVLAAADPVALDSVAYEMIDSQRAAHGMRSLAEDKREPRWLETAVEKGLGTADSEKIERDGFG
ncbi:MAG: DUF362 domain-containing protein [Polyangia bacterium]